MNELVTTGPTTSPELSLDLTDRETCLEHGRRGKRAMLESFRAYVTHHGPPEEWGEEMGLSPKTVRNHYVAELRRDGGEFQFLPKAKQGARSDLKRGAQSRALPTTTSPLAQQPEPIQTTTHLSQARSVREGELMAMPRELGPGEYTHPDYNKIIQLFEQINDLTHANELTDNFSSEEWFSIRGYWQSVGICIRAKCDHIERSQSDRDDSITVDCSEIS